MPGLSPCSRREFVRKLKRLGYDGPFAGGKHQYMTKAGAPPLRIPNPHQADISVGLLSAILRIAGIKPDDWNSA